MSYPPEKTSTPPAAPGDITSDESFTRLVQIQTALRTAETEYQRVVPLASEAARLWTAAQVETMASPTPENAQREATARQERVRLGEEEAALRQRIKVASDGVVQARAVWEKATQAQRGREMKNVHDRLKDQIPAIIATIEDAIAKLRTFYVAKGMMTGRAVDVLAAAVRGDENFERRISEKTKLIYDANKGA